MRFRFRVLPLAIIAAAGLLGMKLGHLWLAADMPLFTAARADARFASRVAGLVLGLEVEDELEPELGLVCLGSLSRAPRSALLLHRR